MIKKLKQFKPDLLFAGGLLILCLAFGWFQTINKGPYSLHQWRQADCLSLTLNYAQNGLKFFQPEIHWTNQNGNHKTVSEFPIVYYMVGVTWNLLAQKHFVYRALTLLLSFLGLFALFKTAQLIFKSKFLAFFPPLFLLGSPLYVYYANGYLMNIYALNFSLIGWYFFTQSFIIKEAKNQWIAGGCFLMAGLLKVTALFNPALAGLILLLRKTNRQQIIRLVTIGVALLIGVLSWYLWSYHYNQENISGIFLQGVLPFWELGNEEKFRVIQLFKKNVWPQFLSLPSQILVGLMLFVSLFYLKRIKTLILLPLFLLTVCSVVYFFLFYQVFDIHDYYLTNFLILPLAIFTLGVYIGERYVGKDRFSVFVPILLFGAIVFSAVQTRIKYEPFDSVAQTFFTLNQEEVEYWEWYHWNYGKTLYEIEKNKKQLQKIIPEQSLIISIPDETINTSLYLMDRKGFTDFGYAYFSPRQKMEKYISLGAKYLVVNNQSALSRPEVMSISKTQLFNEGELFVFEITER